MPRDSIGVRPRDRLNRAVRNRREAVEDRPHVLFAIERRNEGAPHANVRERWKEFLVQRDVLVGIAWCFGHDD